MAVAQQAPAGGKGGGNVYQSAATGMQQAGAATAAGMNYRPMNVNAPTIGTATYNPATAAGPGNVNAQQVQAGQIANTNLNPYMNPFQQQVIDTSVGQLDRARQMTQAQNGASATAAGAFGGSRHGIVEAETNRGFADQVGSMTAGLNAANFNNAQQMAGMDIGNRLQAGLANQGANLQAQTTNVGNRMQNNQFNAGALNTAGQVNAGARNLTNQFNVGNKMTAQTLNQSAGLAGAQHRLGAAAQQGTLANLGFGMGNQIQQQQWQQGGMQQAMMQQLIDAGKGQFSGMQGAPKDALASMLAAIGAGNMGQQTQTTSQTPGLFNYLSLGLGLL